MIAYLLPSSKPDTHRISVENHVTYVPLGLAQPLRYSCGSNFKTMDYHTAEPAHINKYILKYS
jgi:hypothetical protein